VERAHWQLRWFGGGWKLNAELPHPAGFAGATQFITLDDVADAIPRGPDVGSIVEAEEFLEFAESDLSPALRAS
jgi:hypothetical protein